MGGRIVHALALEILGRCTRGSDAESVDADDLLFPGMVDEDLRLPSPAERIVHRGGGPEHGARRVDRVPTLLEHHRAGGSAERLSGDGHPVPAVQYRFLSPLGRYRPGES